MSQIDCDVAVVGASLGGCTAATLFARCGLTRGPARAQRRRRRIQAAVHAFHPALGGAHDRSARYRGLDHRRWRQAQRARNLDGVGVDPRQRQVEGLQHPPAEARPADADARGFHSRRRVRARLHGSRAHRQQWPRHRRGGGAPAAGIAAGLGTARRRSRRARVDGRKARRFARAGQAEQPFCLLHLLSRSAGEPDRELALLVSRSRPHLRLRER